MKQDSERNETGARDAAEDSGMRLWYRREAGAWLEALPVGCGRLGAMVFGGVRRERLQLNEDTLWAGGPHVYDRPDAAGELDRIRQLVFADRWEEAQRLIDERFMGTPVRQMPYQVLGNLTLDFPGADGGAGEAEGYRRELDLETAVAATEFTRDGVRFRREVFASYPDQVIVLTLSADRPGALSFTVRFDTPQQASVSAADGATLALDGTSGGAEGLPGGRLRFRALVRARAEGGGVTAHADRLEVAGATSAILLVSMATAYRGYADIDGDERAAALAHLDAAARHSAAELKARHIADYRRLFGRFQIDLGTSPAAALPTDERVPRFGSAPDPQLAALYVQYGRYLLISCSRPGSQPATLQGVWNQDLDPPWGCKYTININTEMNYWPAARTGLLECVEPLYELLADLAVTGAATAAAHYGAGGWVCHHNTDAWRGTAPVDGAFWGMWPTGGAWLSLFLWEHFLHTGDLSALGRHYPVLKGAARFFLDTLVPDPASGLLVTNPSISPEMAHHEAREASVCAGPTMDAQILRDLFAACAAAGEALGEDADFRGRLAAARGQLPPMRVGRLGQLQEWPQDWDEFGEIGHRHISHLYGLHPGNQITRRGTPDLFEAARRTLELRGDEGTGWSLAWKVNFWARMEEGDRSYKLLTDLLTPERTAPNLFDLHPPFQIDGNFGAAAGITEWLLHGHAGELHPLPALPEGRVAGLRVPGGFEVGLQWREGRLRTATVRSHHGGGVAVRTAEPVHVTTEDGRPLPGTERRADGTLWLATEPGGGYLLTAG